MDLEEHIRDLIPAYALGCLDEGDAVQVAEHLRSCSICQAELQVYQAIADQLPFATPLVEPPPHLKGALVSRIQPAQVSKGETPQRSSWRQQLSQFVRQASPAWSIISLVLIFALLTSNLLLWTQVNRLRDRSQAVMGIVNLSETGFAPGATGLLIISMDGSHGTLVVDNLPVLSEERQYQLWLVDDQGQRTSGGVFSVRESGYTSHYVSPPRPLNSYPGFGVTIEPVGGSPAPTGERVLGGKL